MPDPTLLFNVPDVSFFLLWLLLLRLLLADALHLVRKVSQVLRLNQRQISLLENLVVRDDLVRTHSLRLQFNNSEVSIIARHFIFLFLRSRTVGGVFKVDPSELDLLLCNELDLASSLHLWLELIVYVLFALEVVTIHFASEMSS